MKFNLSGLSVEQMRVLSDALEAYECDLKKGDPDLHTCMVLQHMVLAEAGPDVLWDSEWREESLKMAPDPAADIL